jgi:hypothetical protein
MAQFSYGSIIVDDEGIRKRSLPLIGKGFRLAWDELSSWSASHVLMPATDTGKDEPLSELLELQSAAGIEIVDRRTAGDLLDALVAYLRLRCPEKEAKSELTDMQVQSPPP